LPGFLIGFGLLYLYACVIVDWKHAFVS